MHLATYILFVAALAAAGNCATLSWANIPTKSIANNRWFSGLAYYQGNLFLFGGESLTGILGDTWMLELQGNMTLQWMQLILPTSPSPRYGFVSGVVDNYWVISHGCNVDTCFSDTWIMDLAAPALGWTLLSTSSSPIPEARFAVAGGVYPGTTQLWISMGQRRTGRKLPDTWILELDTTNGIVNGSWREVSSGVGNNQYHPYLPHARFLHSGFPIDNSTFAIFGGCSSGGQAGGPCPVQDSWTIDMESSQWEVLPTCAPGRVRHTMIAVPNRPGSAFVWGGSQTYTPGIFPQQIVPLDYNGTDLYILNVSNGIREWKRVKVDGAPSPREGVSVAMAPDTVYLVGGRTLENSLFTLDLWQLGGDGEDNPSLDCPPRQFSYVHLHGVMMYLAWGLLLPLGVLLGRYYRWSWPVWFVLHVICQSLGVLLTVAGFVIIFLVGSYAAPDFPHAIIGIVLTFILIQQFLTGIFHPCVEKENGKIYNSDKSKYRKCWEVYHAVSGFMSIVIGLGQIMLGVLLIGAPMIVWSLWAALAILWILVFFLHECVYICYKLSHRRKKVY